MNISARVTLEARTGTSYGLSRSAAGMWNEALIPVNQQFIQYWEHGTTSTTQKEIKKTIKLNPTFCYSKLGETFAIYDHSFPQGFHFAPAFTPLVFDPAGPLTNSALAKAKQQFKAGCMELQASRKAHSIIIRFFVGDALSFCRALDLYNKTSDPQTKEFASPWRATSIDLTEHITSSPSPPNTFDVIDTSDLSTDLGLYNILLAAQPLLKKRPASQAVLYTDEGLEKRSASEELRSRVYRNIPTVALLLGLVPRPYISLFTSSCIMHMFTITDIHSGFVERIAWVSPTSGDRYTHSEPDPVISAEPFELIQLLFHTYREMTKHDSPKPISTPFAFSSQLRVTSEPHFTRETFAMLISRVKSRVYLSGGDWAAVISMIRSTIGARDHDSGLITHIRDLEIQLRLHDLPVESMITEDNFNRRVETSPVFRGWVNVPRVICVAFVVPSKKLDPIRGDGGEPWPRLVCEVFVDNDDRYVTYSSIQAVWGSLVHHPESSGKYLIEEDPKQFRGSSDLVVSFWADADILASRPYISLCLRRTQLVLIKYRALGPRLQLFTTRVGGEGVHVLRERPMAGETQPTSRYVSNSLLTDEGVKCQLETTIKGIEDVVSIRATIQVGENLRDTAKPIISQLGPCTLELAFGNEKRIVKFPYPVNHPDCSLSSDQSEGQVHVSAPIFNPIQTGGYPNTPFPIVRHTHPSPWNIHHLYADRMPKVDIQQKSRIRKWLVEHTAVQMSDREQVIQRNTGPIKRRPAEVLVNVKEMITTIVLDYAGVRIPSQGSVPTFSFMAPTYGLYLVVLVGGLRLDLAGATVALDCAIVPITSQTTQDLSSAIAQLENKTQVKKLQITTAEVIAWKHLIPAFVERIRTWPHLSECEYQVSGKIPLSETIDGDPLCQCGRSKGLSGPEWQNPKWKDLLPYATRAAISPLFGVPILESVAGSASKIRGTEPIA